MTIFMSSIYLSGSREETEKTREDSKEKAKRAIMKKFEEVLDEHMHAEERSTKHGMEISYFAGLVERKELVRGSLHHMGLTRDMISLLEEADMMEDFTHEDMLNFDNDNGVKAIRKYIEAKLRGEVKHEESQTWKSDY